MNFRRLHAGLGLVALLAAATAATGDAQYIPPPPPPLPSATTTPIPAQAAPNALFPAAPATAQPSAVLPLAPVPTPTATPSGPVRGHHAPPKPKATPSPEPTDSPEPPQFSSLDGIWEIELQPIGSRYAQYEHFSLVQDGNNLTGYWEHNGRIRTPVTGQFDGRLIQIQADWNGGTVTWAGYVESFGDMVGMRHLTATDPGIAFTAQHRKKE